MGCMKSCWLCIKQLFCWNYKSEGLLSSQQYDLGGMGHLYTVRRISSFGRDILNKDDDTDEIVFNTKCSTIVTDNTSVPFTSRPIPVQTVVEEQWQNYEDTLPKIDNRKLASPSTKQKGRWMKALGKVKKQDPSKSKFATSSELKPTDNGKQVGERIQELSPFKTEVSGLSCQVKTSPIALSTPDLIKQGSKKINKIYLDSPSVKLGSTSDASTLSISSNSWMKSQSMQDVHLEPELPSSKSKLNARDYGLNISLYPSKSQAQCNEDLKQSDDVLGTDYTYQEISLGVVLFSMEFDNLTKKLEVCIRKMLLCGKGAENSSYNPIIKMTILPEEKYYKNSIVLPKNLELNLDFKAKFPILDLKGKILR
uniref:Uncharacterized protein n=2 Tax=Clastoptera arizonana TaxID=38151 RepID=A0A1B6DHK1_9HEMI